MDTVLLLPVLNFNVPSTSGSDLLFQEILQVRQERELKRKENSFAANRVTKQPRKWDDSEAQPEKVGDTIRSPVPSVYFLMFNNPSNLDSASVPFETEPNKGKP